MKTKVRVDKNVTRQELINVLCEVEKGQPVYIIMETEPKMNKTNNFYFGEVKKVTEGRFWVGTEYERRVKNNMVKQGLNPDDFQVSKNNVGEHFSKCVLFNQNRNEYYLQLEYFKETPPSVLFDLKEKSVEEMLRYDFLTKKQKKEESDKLQKEISEFLVKPSVSKKQTELGIEKPVVWISPKISNIKQITYNRVRYIVTE